MSSSDLIRALVLSLLISTPSWAAFAVKANFIQAQDKTAAASWAPVTSAALDADDIAFVCLAKDNTSTTDGDNSEVTSVTDASGNTWNKGAEFTNTVGGAAADGATGSLWWSKITTGLASGGAITFNFASSTTAKAVEGRSVTVGAGNTVQVDGTQTLADDGIDAGSITLGGLADIEHFWMRCTGAEAATTTYTQSTNYDDFFAAPHSGSTTSGGTGITNIGARGESRIFTGVSDPTDPTTSAADHASIMIAFSEIAGGGAGCPKTLALLGAGC